MDRRISLYTYSLGLHYTNLGLLVIIDISRNINYLLMRIQPKIFIPVENPGFIDVKFEQYKHFDIFWYHWYRDGFFNVQDYEPVILVYSDNGDLCYLIVRRGWEYKHYEREILHSPLEVLFESSFHHPFAKKLDDEEYEMKKVNNLISKDYTPSPIKSNEISAMFRTGVGHPTLIKRVWIPVQDPANIAEETYSEYCM